MLFNKKLKAMTYVELALVLTIIGVIAAMTIPQLKKYSQRTDYEKRVQKAYVTLEEVIDNAVMEHGIIKHWAKKTSEDKLFSTYFIPYFSVLEKQSEKSVTTKDGISYSLDSCEKKSSSSTDLGSCIIKADINGLDKEPNLKGKDKFNFKLDFVEEKLIPVDETKELYNNGWKFTDELWSREASADDDSSTDADSDTGSKDNGQDD
ncbi:MAG: type II secretion system protein [Candidatus Gastranaerophilaceae bacterium]